MMEDATKKGTLDTRTFLKSEKYHIDHCMDLGDLHVGPMVTELA
jgi:hypothetical protein